MGKIKKKYESGASTHFISRKKACDKLQLSLSNFRRLCILKGVYPHQPVHRRKAQHGSTANLTIYYKKDIQFLLHEPIINKFRAMRIYARKLKKAETLRQKDRAAQLYNNRPSYKVDHIVRERYPSFIDALRDVDDALCMSFLFASYPSDRIQVRTVDICRRLTVEFMHYVIASNSLRKVFVSIKGYYYQAEIMSQTITWIVPHQFPHTIPTDVDFRVMATFTHFYTTMLGFVLYRLYNSLNLHYPPRVALLSNVSINVKDDNQEVTPKFCTENEKNSEVVSSLNTSLVHCKSVEDEDDKDEDTEKLLEDGSSESEEAAAKRKKEEEFKKLFAGCKIYLSREVPREQLVFVIRCFGGQVSWDKSVGMGSTFKVDDESITHQVIDRPITDKPYISRYYIQPQWIFDCVNARILLPLAGYLPGDELPPHFSPFVNETDGSYIPPERQRVIALQRGEDPGINNEDEDLSEDENEEEGEEDESDDEEPEKPKVSIKPGEKDVDSKLNPKLIAAEEKNLAVMMIPKRNKRLYHKIKFGQKRRMREAEKLAAKRKIIDHGLKKEKRKEKQAKLQTNA